VWDKVSTNRYGMVWRDQLKKRQYHYSGSCGAPLVGGFNASLGNSLGYSKRGDRLGLEPVHIASFHQGSMDIIATRIGTPNAVELVEKSYGPVGAEEMVLRASKQMQPVAWTLPNGGTASWEASHNQMMLKQSFTLDQLARDYITSTPPLTNRQQTLFGVATKIDFGDVQEAIKRGQSQDYHNMEHSKDDIELRGRFGTMGYVHPPQIYVPGRGGRVDSEQHFFTDGVDDWIFTGVKVSQMEQVLLPGSLVIDPSITEEKISTNTDDAYQYDATMELSKVYAGRVYPSHDADAGFRFQTIPIPKDATINTATLTVYRIEIALGDPSLEISCEDTDDAGTFTTSDNDITGRSQTTAKTAWTTGFGSDGADVVSPDFAASVEEVTDRGSWAENNDLVVILTNTFGGSASELIKIEDLNLAGGNEARFNANFTAPASGSVRVNPLRGPFELKHSVFISG